MGGWARVPFEGDVEYPLTSLLFFVALLFGYWLLLGILFLWLLLWLLLLYTYGLWSGKVLRRSGELSLSALTGVLRGGGAGTLVVSGRGGGDCLYLLVLAVILIICGGLGTRGAFCTTVTVRGTGTGEELGIMRGPVGLELGLTVAVRAVPAMRGDFVFASTLS
jgi:hypothetical protein